MINKIKNLVLSLALAVTMLLPAVALPSAASAAANVTENVCSGANNLDLTEADPKKPACNNTSDTTVSGKIATVLNLLSVVIGLVAVIMIIIAGFRYITSGGKEEGVKNAKNTILYAIIGLIIVSLAQVIVQFVLKKSV